MTLVRNAALVLVAALGIAALTEMGVNRSAPGTYGLVSRAEAVVGRPLTPVSVAGVARRTTRRCAAGAYHC